MQNAELGAAQGSEFGVAEIGISAGGAPGQLVGTNAIEYEPSLAFLVNPIVLCGSHEFDVV